MPIMFGSPPPPPNFFLDPPMSVSSIRVFKQLLAIYVLYLFQSYIQF